MARSVGRPSVRSDGDEKPGGVLGRGASQDLGDVPERGQCMQQQTKEEVSYKDTLRTCTT